MCWKVEKSFVEQQMTCNNATNHVVNVAWISGVSCVRTILGESSTILELPAKCTEQINVDQGLLCALCTYYSPTEECMKIRMFFYQQPQLFYQRSITF